MSIIRGKNYLSIIIHFQLTSNLQCKVGKLYKEEMKERRFRSKSRDTPYQNKSFDSQIPKFLTESESAEPTNTPMAYKNNFSTLLLLHISYYSN